MSWNSIELESKPIGWAYAFELTIKVYLNDYKIDVDPILILITPGGKPTIFSRGLFFGGGVFVFFLRVPGLRFFVGGIGKGPRLRFCSGGAS